MRTGTKVALIALGLSAALPATAQPVDELGASVWISVPVFQGFGVRETIALNGDKVLLPWLRVRPSLRLSSPADIQGVALRQPNVPLLGTYYEVAPVVSLLAGGTLGPAYIQGGVGLAYNLRFALTEETVIGYPIVPTGTTSFGTLKELGLTFDPGLDAVVEAGFQMPLGFRLVAGVGGSFAVARLIVRPREDPNIEVAVPESFINWSFQLGVRWSLKDGGKLSNPPPPKPLP